MGQGEETGSNGPVEPVRSPPIAQIAGSAASEAAARELADEIAAARAEGRMVQEIALDQIDETYLTRDRIVADAAELAALKGSIAARGQQMPVELVDLGRDATPRYGLISGWRRMAALKALHADTGEARFATARAVLRRPDTAAEAYLSMVEENELRVGLSYYERAQVAARATDLGVFETSQDAVLGLFPTASKAKRSKINSFVRIFRVLDPVLAFPDQIPERLGLRLAKALDAGQGAKIYTGLQEGGPFPDPAAELARIEKILAIKTGSKPHNRVEKSTYPGGVTLSGAKRALTLKGPGVDATFRRDLEAWLTDRQTRS
jgi:hypothetical protein